MSNLKTKNKIMKTKKFKVIVLIIIGLRLLYLNTQPIHPLSVIVLIVISSAILRSFTRIEQALSIAEDNAIEKQKNYFIFIISGILLLIMVFNPYYEVDKIFFIQWISMPARILFGLSAIIVFVVSGFNLGVAYKDDEYE